MFVDSKNVRDIKKYLLIRKMFEIFKTNVRELKQIHGFLKSSCINFFNKIEQNFANSIHEWKKILKIQNCL